MVEETSGESQLAAFRLQRLKGAFSCLTRTSGLSVTTPIAFRPTNLSNGPEPPAPHLPPSFPVDEVLDRQWLAGETFVKKAHALGGQQGNRIDPRCRRPWRFLRRRGLDGPGTGRPRRWL